MSAALEIRRFEKPDELLDMKACGGIAVVKMRTGATGMRAVFEPGWTWEKDERPLLGNPDSCPMHHTGYCISGTLVVRMAGTNTRTKIEPGDFFEIPPGHDGHVEGDERVELILSHRPSRKADLQRSPQPPLMAAAERAAVRGGRRRSVNLEHGRVHDISGPGPSSGSASVMAPSSFGLIDVMPSEIEMRRVHYDERAFSGVGQHGVAGSVRAALPAALLHRARARGGAHGTSGPRARRRERR